MLQLLIGTDWVANRNKMFSMVAEDVRNELGNRILLVPELISHDAERRLCQTAGDTASRFAEVLSFSRLSRRVSEYTGIPAEACLDNGGRVVAMASAVRQLRGSLKAYASVETKPEFLTGLVDAIDEFKRCCISATDLKLASQQTEGGFAQKIEELSLILEGYNSVTSRGKRDPRDQMTWLLDRLEECSFGADHIFYIDGFPDFTRQHMAILAHFISVSPKVVVSLNCDCLGSEKMAFEKAGETAKAILSVAKKHEVETEILYVPEEENNLSPVVSKLFQGKLPDPMPHCVKTLRTHSPYEEASAAAGRILELVHKGARFRDISVVCGDWESYRTIVGRVFERYKIPHYLSGTESVLARPIIHTVLMALDAAFGGFGQKDILNYLRSALSPIDLSQCDRLENYTVVWGISGNKWLQPWDYHPDGLGQKWTDESRERLAELNAIRQLVTEPLVALRGGFRNATRLSEQVQALYAFLEDIQIGNNIEKLAEEYDREGDNRSAQVLNQLWDILLSALEQLYDVLGDTAWDSDTFTQLLRLLLSQYDVGTIPPTLDAVTAGPVNAMRCQEAKHLIVLGMLEGNMPGYGGSTGVLTDKERVALREMGVPLTGGAIDGITAEFSEIYGVFCGARESICTICPEGQPSVLFRRLTEISGGEQAVVSCDLPIMGDPQEVAAVLSGKKMQKVAEELGIGAHYRQFLSKIDFAIGNISTESVHGLYGNVLRLSASQIDKQAECKMRYFLQYGLRAKERKTATVDPAEYGTYVHAVLEETARDVMSKGGFSACSEQEVLQIANKHSEDYIKDHFGVLDSSRTAYLLARNFQELQMVVLELWDELRQSKFVPRDFEVSFGDGGKMPAINVTGATMEAQIRGFVDRVDVWNEAGQNYFRVVDYKTGRKDFDYCDVFNGIGLQMLLYLFALEQGGEPVLGERPVPAGVQYFPARAPVVAADGALSDERAADLRIRGWKRKGLLLKDNEVLSAMEPKDAPHRLDCSEKKDGSITGAVADRSQFKMLKDYIFSLLHQMVDSIASGDVTPNPYMRGSYHNACAYCPYGQVCHPDELPERREYQAMSAERFWEEIGKELKRNG